MAMVLNPKWAALNRLKSYVSSRNEVLGFSSGHVCLNPGNTYSSSINAPGTWESTLADDHATATKTEVDSLSSAFTDLEDDISAAMGLLDEYIDEDDPLADWPNQS